MPDFIPYPDGREPARRASGPRSARVKERERQVAAVGRYFGREPRYTQQEAEAQAKQAIDAAVSKGRPPEEDWKPLASRMPDLNRELATRPAVEIPPPPARRRAEPGADPASAGSARPRRPMNQILRPPSPPAEPALAEPAKPAAAAPAKRAKRAAPPEAPAKRAAPAPKPPAPGPAKRTTAQKRPG